MSARPLVHVTRRLPTVVEAALSARFETVLSRDDRPMDAAELQRALGEADAVLCTVTDRIGADVMAVSPRRARMIASYGVGTDHIDLVAAAAHELVVSNTPDVLTDCTADLTMALLLATLRRTSEGERELRGGRWTGMRPTHMLGARVSGRTLGIIGLGRIGRAVARRAHFGFGMRVLGYSRSPIDSSILAAHGIEAVATREHLLAEADVVSLHCPSTAATRGMINAATIALMKPGSFLINTARGDLVDDEAVISAVLAGHLAGIGLDVYRGEPHFDRRYLALERAVLVPHLGSATQETREAMGFRVIANLEAFFAGGEVPDRVG
jgi:lactate dehydrogenase-like 2-hydroxyacid dehydrogenase